jgi:hypothetical protein
MTLTYDNVCDWWVWLSDKTGEPVSPRFDYEEDAVQWKIFHQNK